jgi:hypothetical protein
MPANAADPCGDAGQVQQSHQFRRLPFAAIPAHGFSAFAQIQVWTGRLSDAFAAQDTAGGKRTRVVLNGQGGHAGNLRSQEFIRTSYDWRSDRKQEKLASSVEQTAAAPARSVRFDSLRKHCRVAVLENEPGRGSTGGFGPGAQSQPRWQPSQAAVTRRSPTCPQSRSWCSDLTLSLQSEKSTKPAPRKKPLKPLPLTGLPCYDGPLHHRGQPPTIPGRVVSW